MLVATKAGAPVSSGNPAPPAAEGKTNKEIGWKWAWSCGQDGQTKFINADSFN